ncbi:LOW QUALITY PROTEIN: homeobox protein knotted-1-like 6, partial [Phalaenopsis equestris]|uniref:LOW QUALITY PROTEIN: homeobox protein knotted-1-like 6 n=1 Tax=Phalaenopsis equestris TaxID=78828 RepID=UPI0009E3EB05
MDEMYSLPPASNFTAAEEHPTLIAAAGYGAVAAAEEEMKTRIASHPRYPHLLEAHLLEANIDCQKLGAPPDIVSLLEDIRRENAGGERGAASSLMLGSDPELDEFMEMYCDVLVKYRRDLERPFDEATAFLNTMEIQLSDLCKPTCRAALGPYVSGKQAVLSLSIS